MDKKYYTVAEFAKKVGTSRATLYRKTEKELASFCIIRNGKKVVSANALKLFDISNKTHNLPHETVMHENVETNMINILYSQLREKDIQIAKINDQLKVKDEQLNEKDLQIARRDEQISELTKAFREAQALHAGTLQRELSDNTIANDEHRWWKFWHKKK